MRLAAIAALAAALGLFLMLRPPGVGAQPQVTYTFPEEGVILAEPPPILRMCFASPVNIQDLHEGGDFRFRVVNPEGLGLGLRIVFRPDALGVDILPGLPEKPQAGPWTFEWRVTDPDTLEPAEGTLTFTVGPGGSPVPDEPPETCDQAATPAPSVTATPETEGDNGDEGDEGPDVWLIILIAAAAVIGVAALGVMLHIVRRRAAQRSHEPSPPDSEGNAEGP